MTTTAKNLFAHFSIVHLGRIFWLPMFIFAAHVFVSRVLHGYILFPSLDIPMHYLGGLSMGYSSFLALAFLQQHKIISPLDKAVAWVFVFTLVTTIAVFWEFAEFSMDQLIGTNLQLHLPNTMQDLFMGMLGAVTIIGYKMIKKAS